MSTSIQIQWRRLSGRKSNTSRGMTIGLSREERVDQEVKTQKLLEPDGK